MESGWPPGRSFARRPSSHREAGRQDLPIPSRNWALRGQARAAEFQTAQVQAEEAEQAPPERAAALPVRASVAEAAERTSSNLQGFFCQREAASQVRVWPGPWVEAF